jgi:23S rRNA pseudouridine1911/1915/1917 synthase
MIEPQADSPYDTEEESELFEHHRIEADKGQNPLRIDKFLSNRIEGVSRNILANGKAVKSNYKVKPLDVITIVMDYPRRELEIIPENIPLDIRYEDNDVLVVNKPAGLVVHPGYGNYTGTLVNALAYHFKHLEIFSANDQRPGLVHRIDKNTTGLLVIAKNEHAKMHLARQFFERTTTRRYRALIWGCPKESEGTIVGNIGRSLKNRKMMEVFEDGDYGKPAITHYKVLEHLGYISIVECKLETGRTHQIRVHMKHLGHPLFNDIEYGGDQVLKGTTFSKYKQFVQNCFNLLPGQALHAQSLGFTHPVTGEFMEFEVDLPESMEAVIKKWRTYIEARDLD